MRIINLLPKPKQQELRFRKLYFSLVTFTVLASITFLLVVVGQVATRLYLQYDQKNIETGIERLKNISNKEENAALKARIKLINNQITDFNNIMNGSPKWSKVLRAFAVVVPEQVTIQTLTAEAGKKQVQITGFSPGRELVIALYNNIAADKTNFTTIDYPLENVTRPADVYFHFTFTVADSLLQ